MKIMTTPSELGDTWNKVRVACNITWHVDADEKITLLVGQAEEFGLLEKVFNALFNRQHVLTTILYATRLAEAYYDQSPAISGLFKEAKWRVEIALALVNDEQAANDWREERTDQRPPL